MKKSVLNYWKNFVKLLLISFLLISCKTFVPKPVVDQQASWDGNVQNSGIVNYIDNVGFLITENAAQRYMFLTKKLGETWTPPLKPGEGLTYSNGNYYLPNEYFVKFAVMNRQWKEK